MSQTAFKKPMGKRVAFQIAPFKGQNLVAFQTPLGKISNSTKIKMTLTKHNHPAILCPPQHEVGCGNPRRQGDKTPQLKAVFFCPSFFHSPDLGRAIHIMMGLFGQSLRLVAPCRGITTPLSPVANTVVSIGVGYPTFRQGITA